MCNDEEISKKINKAVFPGIQGGPLEHVIAGKAVAFGEALKPEFKAYQHQIVLNAAALAKTLQDNGVLLVSGGTDNHLMLVNLTNFDITGKELETLLDECNITVNKNSIPNDPQKPSVTSGIRVGTPSVTTRGMKEEDMVVIGNCIAKVIKEKEGALDYVRAEVKKLTEKYPLYRDDVNM